MAGKKRPRTERRAHERTLRKEVRGREKLATAVAGGRAETPIVVTSSAQVEIRARATVCPQCGGTLDLLSHGATPGDPDLRTAKMICRTCHTPRTLWFRIELPLAN